MLTIQTEGNFAGEKMQLKGIRSTRIHFHISLSKNYTPPTRKLIKDKRIIKLDRCSTDMAIKNENIFLARRVY